MDLKTTLVLTEKIARTAGKILRAGFSQIKEINYKSTDTDPVTQFDLASEKYIKEQIQHHFPDHRIMAEESGATAVSSHSPYIWYIDPLDGTVNFTHGFPHFSVSMALFQGNTPILGVVYDPMRDECFAAAKGHGATLNGASIQVSHFETLLTSMLVTGFPYNKHLTSDNNSRQTAVMIGKVQSLRRTGSAALDLAYVAGGRLDGYWEFGLSSWDVAAGILLVQEAGGQVTNMDGTPYQIIPPYDLIASNGRIHQAMVDELNAITAGA